MPFKCLPPTKPELIKTIQQETCHVLGVTRVDDPSDIPDVSQMLRQFKKTGIRTVVIMLQNGSNS